jgi:16S rRNA G966 N2-methylase RsmD
VTAVLLDPPYSYLTGRNEKLYNYEDGTVAQDVAMWVVEHGDDERFRIAGWI